MGRYRTRWNCGPDTAYFCPQSMSLTSCDFGELTKSASPQWSLGTVDVCAMPVWKIAGDDLGNTIVASSTSLTKYDPSGQVNKVMPDPFGGVVLLDNVEENPLALGPQGEIYLGGRTNTEIRLAKADASGILQWSNSVPTPNDSEPKCFSYALDKSGNILVAFNAASVVDLGNGPMPRLGTKDLILAKLDPQSNVIWAKRFGGPGFDAQSCSLRRTGADDIALVLGYAGMVDLGDGALQSSPVLAKFDAMGTIVWHADLATRFPLLPADEQHWVLTGHPSGAVMVSGSGTHHYPSGKNPSGASRYLDLQFVVAKYGP